MADKNASTYRFANETDEQRIQRHASFRESESDFLNPFVLQNLGMTEPVAEDVMQQTRRMYEEDLLSAKKQDPKIHYGFDAWLNKMALELGQIDPKSPEGQVLNPIGTAELYREFMRLARRNDQAAMGQELRDQQQRMGGATQAALGIFGAADEFARTASGGASDVLATGINRIVGGEKQAEKYLAGREWLQQLESGANPAVRFARGFGGLLGFITPAGGLGKAAKAGQLALTGGKTALKEGTWRYGLNKALSSMLGAGAEGAGLGSRMATSAGNFLATDGALKLMREISDISNASMAGRDWRQALADLHSKPEWELFQSALSGATMPMMQKAGDTVARILMGGAGSSRRAQMLAKSLKEMEDWGLRTQAVIARGTGGAVEFMGFSAMPNVHNQDGMFGVAKDFALLFGEDSPERTKAIENILFHAANGFLLKNLHGKPVNEMAEKDRAAALAPGVDRLGVAEAAVEAKRSYEEEANALFPDREMVEQIRANNEGAAYEKIGHHILRQYAKDIFGEKSEQMSDKDIMDNLDPEQQGWVTDAVNEAIHLVGSTGKGYSLKIQPYDGTPGKPGKPKVISYSKENAGRYGLTESERKAVRQAMREIVEATTPEERDAAAANLINQQAVAEAAAGMGMGDAEKGAIDSVMNGIADSAAEASRMKEGAGAAKPEEAIRSREIELEGLYRKIDAAQQANRLDLARTFAEKAATIETELDTLRQAEAPKGPESKPGTAENPLTPGVKPKPLAEPSPGDVTWPEGFDTFARGQALRILVGETSDKKGIFRSGVILHVDESGIGIAEAGDGSIFAFTPADVARGSVRGEVFRGIDPNLNPDAPVQPKTEQQSGQEIEYNQIRARGDTIEPVRQKPLKDGPTQGPPVALLGAGPDVTPAPAKTSGGAGPKPPVAPSPTPTTKNDVSPSAAKTSARLGSNRQNQKSAGQQSAPSLPVVPGPTSAVEKKASPPEVAPPAPPVSSEARTTSVPNAEWIAKAPIQDINAKIGAVSKYMRELRNAGRSDTPEYNGARAVLASLAKEGYKRRNPDKPKAEEPKPVASSTPEADAAFRAVAPKAEEPAVKVETPAPAVAEPVAEKPARLGSNRKKASAIKHEAKAAGDTATAQAATVAQAAGIVERQGKRIQEERKRARTDPLTGVSNNREEYAASPRSKGKHWGVFDATSLGLTNNNVNQAAGDTLLKDAAKRIQELSGIGPDTIFRGSKADEFYVAGDPEQIVKLGNALADIAGEPGKIAEHDTPYGKIHNRLVGGVGATVADAEDAMQRAKTAFAEHAKKQGYLDKTKDPSKGWRPAGGAGKAKAEGSLPSDEAASATAAARAAEKAALETQAAGPAESGVTQNAKNLLSLYDKRERNGFKTMVSPVKGKSSQVYLSDLPDGYSVLGAVKSGNSAQVFLHDKTGKIFTVTTGKPGVREPAADWKQPENTKNIIVFNEKGDVVYKGETVVKAPDVSPEPESDTGRIETREQAVQRLASFRRKSIERGEQSGVTDPVRRAYDIAGALAADPRKSAEAARVMEDDLYKRITKMQDEGASKESLERANAAYTAVRRVREAKQKIEELDRRIKIEEEMVSRTANEINPARLISTQDSVLTTSQQTAKELAAKFKTKVEEEIDRLRAGRQVKDLSAGDARKYAELHQLRKLADSLIFSSPVSKNYGLIDVSQQAMPMMAMGDRVEIAVGGKENGHLYRGIVLGSGEPSAAGLKRGVGTSGQRLREALFKQRSGQRLSDEERNLIESSSRFPGKWVTIFTDEGETVRVRVSDIADVGPESIDRADFKYDPEKQKYGVEVTETRFMSWFTPPDVAPRSRNISGSGPEEQVAERRRALLDNEPDGYYTGSGDKSRIITGEEAAKFEAENAASKIRNRTAGPDVYRYQALAMLAPEKSRKTIVSEFAARNEEVGVTAEERKASMTPEQLAAYNENVRKGAKLPEDTFSITTRYFKPGSKLRSVDSLSDAERREYDNWNMLAQKAEKEQIDREIDTGVYEKNRKSLVPLHVDSQNGEWLIQHRMRGEDNVLREGQTLLAERTHEGTVFIRKISATEAEAWMNRLGKGDDWQEYRRQSRREYARLTSDNERILNFARNDTQMRDYLSLLRKQFDEIIDGRTQEFKFEGDLHRAVRQWVKENPAPIRNTFGSPEEYNKALADYKRNAEIWMFSSPHTERTKSVEFKPGEEGSGDVNKWEATVEDADFIGKPRNEGGPMFRAAERVRVGREPNSGAEIRLDDTGRVKYVNAGDEARDFYRAAHKSNGVVFGMAGLGYIPGGSSGLIHNFTRLANGAIDIADRAIRAFHKVTRIPANLYSGVMDGISNSARGVTDTLFFKHVHDLLHHPDYGSSVVGETGKAAARKLGILLGESDVAPQMRIYHNDMEGDFYDVAMKATNALRAFSHLPREEQLRLIDQYENGNTPEILKEYRDLADKYGESLTNHGIFSKEATERFKGRYVHHGRWEWKQGDIDAKIKETEALLAGATDNALRGKYNYHLKILRAARDKTSRSSTRTFIGSHPLDMVDRYGVRDLFNKGFDRERRFKTVKEAEKHGLDTSSPIALLMDGLLVEGRADAQARMLKRVLADPSIVKDVKDAPADWILIDGPRYSNDPIFKSVVGRTIEPQALSLIEALNPDRSKFIAFYDMVSGLIKMGLTTANPTNWHTQMLGNVYTLATKLPAFHIPSRLASAFITLLGHGKNAARLEKYKRWNWTQHTGDAVREMSRMLSEEGYFKQEGAALNQDPYLGMGMFQTLGESLKRIAKGKVRSGLRGITKATLDFFTSFDAAARIALFEHLNETMRMPEIEARKVVDNYFDLQHLPKGWKFSRRWFNQFGSIQATMNRNIGELAPNSPVAITNLAILSWIWNAAIKSIYGVTDDDEESLVDASIPKNNAFHEWVGKKTAMLMPNGRGGVRVVDMNKWSPIDTAIRAVPGMRAVVSGAENMAMEGEWGTTAEGKGFGGNIADFASSNLIYGPSLDYIFDRDRFNEGRGVKSQMQDEGAFGRTGYLRYMIERGNLPSIVAAILPPGFREFAAGAIPTGVKMATRAGSASEAGFMGTKPRYVTETMPDGSIRSRQYDKIDMVMETLGFQFSRPNEYARVREILSRGWSVDQGRFGLSKAGRMARGSDESDEARQSIADDKALALIESSARLVAMINHYKEVDQEDKPVIGKQIAQAISTPGRLTAMIRQLTLMEEFDMAAKVAEFFASEQGMRFIPAGEKPVEKMTKGRFGSLRNK